jgi:hypothetical protein
MTDSPGQGAWKRREVTVRDGAGKPVPGAIVEVVRGTAAVPEVGRLTDAGGRLWLSLPPGRFTLRAVTADGGRGEADASGEDDETISIEISKAP